MSILSANGPVVRPRSAPRYANWGQALKDTVRDPGELCRLLDLPPEIGERARAASGEFPLVVPRGFIARMQPGNPHDPLLRQVLPLNDEMQSVDGFSFDPVAETHAELAPGVLQKYAGRALMVVTGTCAVHCRYCFRRHFPYEMSPARSGQWDEAIDSIRSDPSIHEVLLSGGDPLSLVDETLAELAEQLALIPHLQRLRLHTRLPIVIPERVTDEFITWLTGTRLTPIMVVHANHANEIDAAVASALGKVVDAGIPVLNQAVLLAGVNDSANALAELCERLIDLRVMPYYLHQLDRVAGAAHFEVPIERGCEIMNELHGRLPGYAVPRYVQEQPGASGKIALD
ncbi:MAG: EF-P beta-lysylation protein EpmB [Pirellulales bacterium]